MPGTALSLAVLSLAVLSLAVLLLTVLVGAVDGLRQPLERENIGRSRTFRGGAFYYRVLAAAHGFDQLGFFCGVFDPGAVLLGIERKRRRSDRDGRIGIRLEGVTNDDRDFVAHLIGGPRCNEHVGRIARLAGRSDLRRRRLGNRETNLFATRRSRVGAPVAILGKQRRLGAARGRGGSLPGGGRPRGAS